MKIDAGTLTSPGTPQIPAYRLVEHHLSRGVRMTEILASSLNAERGKSSLGNETREYRLAMPSLDLRQSRHAVSKDIRRLHPADELNAAARSILENDVGRKARRHSTRDEREWITRSRSAFPRPGLAR